MRTEYVYYGILLQYTMYTIVKEKNYYFFIYKKEYLSLHFLAITQK